MNQDEEFKQQIQANDVGERMSEFAQYKKWKDEHDPSKPLAKTFCPNCEKETECTHTAELYECEECGEDFAKYIVGRTEPSKSDVSVTQDVLTDIETPSSIENTNPDYYKDEVHEFHFTEALRNLSKSRPADVSAIGVSILIDYVEELESEIVTLRQKVTDYGKEICKLKEANEDVQNRLDDYRQDYAKVVNDNCPTDERHCGCVPILRRENRLISEELADAKDELNHRRDALVDAQRIYNKANEQKVHYLSALQFIAGFVNAKDKTTVDDLIAIARKEIDAEGDQIVDACNYWVSKLRDVEDKLQDAQLKPKTVYTVTMYRYGNREWHSYVLGAFSSNSVAREWAAKEEEYRDGKYKAEIIRWGIDSPTDFLKGEL